MSWVTGYKNYSFLPEARQVRLSLQVSLSIYSYLLIYYQMSELKNTSYELVQFPPIIWRGPREVEQGTMTKITMQIGELGRNPGTHSLDSRPSEYSLYFDKALTLSPIQSPLNRWQGHSVVSNINKKCQEPLVIRRWSPENHDDEEDHREQQPPDGIIHPKLPPILPKGGEVHFYT